MCVCVGVVWHLNLLSRSTRPMMTTKYSVFSHSVVFLLKNTYNFVELLLEKRIFEILELNVYQFPNCLLFLLLLTSVETLRHVVDTKVFSKEIGIYQSKHTPEPNSYLTHYFQLYFLWSHLWGWEMDAMKIRLPTITSRSINTNTTPIITNWNNNNNNSAQPRIRCSAFQV